MLLGGSVITIHRVCVDIHISHRVGNKQNILNNSYSAEPRVTELFHVNISNSQREILSWFKHKRTAVGECNLGDKIERSVEPATTVHILPVFSLLYNVSPRRIVSFNMFALCGVEIAETHQSHHRCFINSLISNQYNVVIILVILITELSLSA